MKEMRRKDRGIDQAETKNLLTTCEYGIFSTADGNNQPYGVPVNYVYQNDAIYFHCAKSGHKLDNIKDNPSVSFCVVGKTKVLSSEFAAEYESAVAFGIASVIQGTERNDALVAILEKYSPEFITQGMRYIEKNDKATTVIKIDIHHMTGKARR
jgi:uncharacterized protein